MEEEAHSGAGSLVPVSGTRSSVRESPAGASGVPGDRPKLPASLGHVSPTRPRRGGAGAEMWGRRGPGGPHPVTGGRHWDFPLDPANVWLPLLSSSWALGQRPRWVLTAQWPLLLLSSMCNNAQGRSKVPAGPGPHSVRVQRSLCPHTAGTARRGAHASCHLGREPSGECSAYTRATLGTAGKTCVPDLLLSPRDVG